GPFNEEPFFTLRCRVGERRFKILCYIYEPGAGVWVVECPPTLGWLARLRGRREEVELSRVVGALHESLQQDARVHEMRWFHKLQASPFSAGAFGATP